MKVFLTGATGFIGSTVLKTLCEENIDTIANRRNIYSQPKISFVHKMSWLTKPMDEIGIDDLKNVDVLIHLASHSVQYPFDSLDNCITFNVTHPLKLFKTAFAAGVKKFIIAGTCFEYGESGQNYDFIPVNAALLPTNTYATSKAMAYLAFRQFSLDYPVAINYHRIFHVFGEGESLERLWPKIRIAAKEGVDLELSPGEQIRDFINVVDVATQILASAKKLHLSQERGMIVQNLGSGNPQSVKEFVTYWWKRFEATGKLKFGAISYRKNEIMRFVPKLNKD
ncbi:MAG: NAD-dependent epimerase/dehydratase family protein [Sediminibacterium sp.]